MRLLYLVVDFEKLWIHRKSQDCWIELFWTNWMGRVLADTSAHLSKKVAKSGPDLAFVGRICQVNLRRLVTQKLFTVSFCSQHLILLLLGERAFLSFMTCSIVIPWTATP